MQVCRQWAGGAADGLRGHRCGAGAGAGAGLLLAGGAGGRGDLLRWWCAGVVIVRAARSSGRAAADPAGRAGVRQAAGLEDGQKKKARAGGAVCAAALAFGLRWRGGAAPGASRCRWWAVVGCSPVPVPVRCWHWHCSRRNGSSWQRSSMARPALAVLHPVRFCPAAGGVRFSTLPGSALGVGLELSRL